MASARVRVRRQQEFEPRGGGTALTPAATAIIVVSAAALAGWLWSKATQPDIDAQTRARLQARQPEQGLA